MNFQFIR